MLSNYISLNGRTAGPIQIGAAGAWISTTTPVTPSGAGQVSFLTSLSKGTLCQLRAASPSISDDFGVVTVEFLKQYGFNPDDTTVDFSNFLRKEVFDDLYNIIVGTGTYPTDKDSITSRIVILEREVSAFDASTDELTENINRLNSLTSANESAIVALNSRIDSLDLDPFQGAVLFVAGGAVTG